METNHSQRPMETEVYQVLANLVMHSEQIRWTRLNSFLVVNSIFILAWAAVFDISNAIPFRSILLLMICVPGLIGGFIWSVLGWRSSNYLDDFHKAAEKLEKGFPDGLPRPFHLSKKRRNTVRITSSKSIVTITPIVFVALYVGLIIWSYN